VAFDLAETRALARDAAAYAAPADVAGFAELIDDLLHDPQRRQAMGQAGRRRVEDELAWDHQQRAYLDVYRTLLDRAPTEETVPPHVDRVVRVVA
jgi:glycosyltransferase involved in cell wall biosynthesis